MKQTADVMLTHAPESYKERVHHQLMWTEGKHHFQVPPRRDWLGWMIQAGRGSGKTRAGAEDCCDYVLAHPNVRYAIVASKWGDARNVCIEGVSGVMAVLRDMGEEDVLWNRSLGELKLRNGSMINIYTAQQPDRLRGPQHHRAWLEELASWDDAVAGDALGTTFNNLMLGLRLGDDPRYIVTTTPKPVKLIRELTERDDVAITYGTSYDNLVNLAPQYREIIERYEGTRIGRQEVLGELLEDVEGALWIPGMFDDDRWRTEWGDPECIRVYIGVDPSGGSSESSGETGIVAAGQIRGKCPCGQRLTQPHYAVLGDHSLRGTPDVRARAIVVAYDVNQADRVIGERNYGGDLVEALVRQAAGDDRIPYEHVNATRGKAIRAEPVATTYEQHRVHHVGAYPQLEDQMTTWTPDAGWSPDRFDACLIAGTSILTEHGHEPIEAVTPGTLVWTRAGWRPVEATRLTRRRAPVITIELSNGQQLTGTPDHRVYTSHGWRRLDALVWGDTLSGWTGSPTEESSTAGTRKGHNEHIGSTTRRREAPARTRSTVRSTATITDLSPMAGMSIISTVTPSTTTQGTWWRSLRRNTQKLIRRIGYGTPNGWIIWIRSVHSLRNGIARLRDWRGIASTAGQRGKIENRLGHPDASNAVRRPKRGSLGSGSAPVVAIVEQQTENTDMSDRSTVRSAVNRSGKAPAKGDPRPVHTVVVRSYAGGEADVYDLQIADAREFVASGVVVHNCVWAITKLQERRHVRVERSRYTGRLPNRIG